eukprot:CAMPEP_0181274638 /NCGR_PEP_ID=MMETSP1097-20121128/9376_1 /TAXON_ID=35684 /ORGANISM="Pseudopedinella elastica, Strain CCMP716" /LENGTH=41 /DNA_ID= /DNA_START= /DNA_END= /DNA_ORIENTATION=
MTIIGAAGGASQPNMVQSRCATPQETSIETRRMADALREGR